MARTPVQAAGGIVLRQAKPPLIALVRLRKRNEWVLPKGKLDQGETPREAAEREVNEETGHDVIVHEFLGTLVYDSGGRAKIVHFWRMQADGEQVYELMTDVREVEWLPLPVALVRLSRASERAFLETVGPLALESASAGLTRGKKIAPTARAAAAKKRRTRVPGKPGPATPELPALAASAPVESSEQPQSRNLPFILEADVASAEPAESVGLAASAVEQPASGLPAESAGSSELIVSGCEMASSLTAAAEITTIPGACPVEAGEQRGVELSQSNGSGARKTLAQKLRTWLVPPT